MTIVLIVNKMTNEQARDRLRAISLVVDQFPRTILKSLFDSSACMRKLTDCGTFFIAGQIELSGAAANMAFSAANYITYNALFANPVGAWTPLLTPWSQLNATSQMFILFEGLLGDTALNLFWGPGPTQIGAAVGLIGGGGLPTYNNPIAFTSLMNPMLLNTWRIHTAITKWLMSGWFICVDHAL